VLESGSAEAPTKCAEAIVEFFEGGGNVDGEYVPIRAEKVAMLLEGADRGEVALPEPTSTDP